jgi:alpha-amylase
MGPDINWQSKNVQTKMGEFFNKLIDFGVAGFRLQFCKYLWPEEIKIILSVMKPLNTDFGFKSGEEPYITCEFKAFSHEAISK